MNEISMDVTRVMTMFWGIGFLMGILFLLLLQYIKKIFKEWVSQ